MIPQGIAPPNARADFRQAYAAHRADEGRGESAVDALTLPYVSDGPLARQWSVRARSWEAFERLVLRPALRRADVRAAGPLRVLDLGAGNGWLAHRAAVAGAEALALDVRDDAVDGLGAAPRPGGAPRIERVAASFEAIPVCDAAFDVVVFNAALHYAENLSRALGEARRVVRSGGRVAIVDSPFYASSADGDAMVAEKRRDAAQRFGARAPALLALPFVEYLTRERLEEASRGTGLGDWCRHRVLYPVWYELRGLRAWLRRERAPSRFDVWESVAA